MSRPATREFPMTDRQDVVRFVTSVAVWLERSGRGDVAAGLRVAGRALAECRCAVEGGGS